MTDIVEKLRAPAYWMSGSSEGHEGENSAPREAADEIERLRAALEPFTCTCEDQCMADAEWASPPAKPSADICAHFAARAALQQEKSDE